MPELSPQERQRRYAKKHYQENKELYKARAKVHAAKMQTKVRKFILDFLLANPCIDCGEVNPIVLEFDHRVAETKKFAIGEAVGRGYSIKSISEEIDKCDVRCANCHRIKTYKERGYSHRDI